MEPVFLSLEEVLEIHADQVRRFGGDPGVRDLTLLESAVAQPQAGFGNRYLHSDLFEMAAAYLFHMVRNHPFVDGNKRTGAAAALVFLKLNEIDVRLTNPALVKTVVGVAQGKIGKAAVAELFRKKARQ
ncbi:MAG TPA: type II toxin-antitoxin system death-on-curing family toxin [Nitrospiria bacterium]|nr:type II toxin-antitoxin system death-on-curing family toxin [Nitrospiria bacterium]